jgi:hypothetical protein
VDGGRDQFGHAATIPIYLGGAHNFDVDRVFAEKVLEGFPEARNFARHNRRLLQRDRIPATEVAILHAEDDLGGRYPTTFGVGSGHGDYEDVTLRLLPRLAHTATLTFSGTTAQVAVDVRLGTG